MFEIVRSGIKTRGNRHWEMSHTAPDCTTYGDESHSTGLCHVQEEQAKLAGDGGCNFESENFLLKMRSIKSFFIDIGGKILFVVPFCEELISVLGGSVELALVAGEFASVVVRVAGRAHPVPHTEALRVLLIVAA